VKIDLHIYTKTGSDGNLSIEEVFKEAKNEKLAKEMGAGKYLSLRRDNLNQ